MVAGKISPRRNSVWLDAYDASIGHLEQNADVYGPALEHDDCPAVDIRQLLFKTRRGRVYRLIFFIDERDVYVLRVRGPGQPLLQPDEMA